MAKTLAKIQQEIARLELQAEALRQREVAGVVARIKEAIKHYQLTAADLFAPAAASRAQPGAKKTAKAKSAVQKSRKGIAVPIKYKDDQGNTWTGRGTQPRWLTAALGAGKKLEDFAV